MSAAGRCARSCTSGQISASVLADGVAVHTMTGGSPPASTTGRLRGGGSGRRLDAYGRGTTSGTPVVVRPCNGQDNEKRITLPYP
ncbi:hypothetical protein [Streptomyces sp. NEAU-H22]|uniref:hypothetical protein n=2 Tax=unclassified Streptomyces TaxID=2593676 RepID=UPI003A598CAF